VIYRVELSRATDGVWVDLALTRASSSDWTGLTGRVDSKAIQRLAFSAPERPWVCICGPSRFVESITQAWSEPDRSERIKTERFGGGTR
jgi:hypothetical protein